MPVKGSSVKNEPKHCVDDENAERSRMRGHHPKPREQFSDSLHDNPPPWLGRLPLVFDADLLGCWISTSARASPPG